MGEETKIGEQIEKGDNERTLKTSNFFSRLKQAREVNPFHSHAPLICGLRE